MGDVGWFWCWPVVLVSKRKLDFFSPSLQVSTIIRKKQWIANKVKCIGNRFNKSRRKKRRLRKKSLMMFSAGGRRLGHKIKWRCLPKSCGRQSTFLPPFFAAAVLVTPSGEGALCLKKKQECLRHR